MFGKIIRIEGNHIFIENTSGKAETSLIGYHIVLSDANRKTVAEILNMSDTQIEALLIGEIKDNKFTSNTLKKPSGASGARIITKQELELLIGSQDYSNYQNLLLGDSKIYDGFKVTCSLNDLMSNHFAILGNTGSGKSCFVARMIQNIFTCNDNKLPTKAHLVLFDAYGEYKSALEPLGNIPGIRFKNYTTQVGDVQGNLVQIPAYFLGVDDLALLLDVEDESIMPVIENTLRLTYIFNAQTDEVTKYKNYIIAQSLLDILSSGRATTTIRDQVTAVLTKYNTPELSLDTVIHQPGYDRTLKQCLLIDQQGKMNAIGLVMEFLAPYANFDITKLDITPNFVFTLDDFAYALDFSLVNEGVLNSSVQYDKLNVLKVRLNAILQSDYKNFFTFDAPISKEDYIQRFFLTNMGEPAQLINMNFNYVDDRMAKTLTKIFAKLFFDYVTNLKERGSFPIHMLLEEAHRYVANDADNKIIGYNVFDRITKEGRKYGLLLGFITQRPSELSTTSLSQCANFVVLKMYYPDDLTIVEKMTANLDKSMIEKIKSFEPGTAIGFGSAFKTPIIFQGNLPDPMPKSTSINVNNLWF